MDEEPIYLWVWACREIAAPPFIAMPTSPLRYCAAQGCGVLVTKGRCATHATHQEHGRGNWDTRRWYRQARWLRLRQQVIFEQANRCAICGTVTLELDVDHIVKHGGDYQRFHDRTGLQALCKSCHSAKTGRGE